MNTRNRMTGYRLTQYGSVLRFLAPLALTLACAVPALAQQGLPIPSNQGTSTDSAVSRNNLTRVYGTVYDSRGEPLPDVDIWIANNVAPANRLRSRTKGTGSFNARNLGRVFTERDLGGVDLRLTFETDGYRDFEVVVGVARDAGERVDVMLLEEGEEPEIQGVNCVLTGKIANAKGKGIKGATAKVSWEGRDEMSLQTAKGGEYEFLLWGAPEMVHLEVTGPGMSPYTADIPLEAHENAAIVATMVHNVGGER